MCKTETYRCKVCDRLREYELEEDTCDDCITTIDVTEGDEEIKDNQWGALVEVLPDTEDALNNQTISLDEYKLRYEQHVERAEVDDSQE